MSQTQSSVFGRRVVFFGAAEDVNEPALLQLFSRHGDVSGLFLVRSALGLPSGCGYVTMGSAEQAAAAAAALQGTSDCAEPGCGGRLGLLVVQPPAGTQSSGSEESMVPKDSRTVFFTKVPPTVTAHQLIQLFTSCGEVVHVELFTPWPGAKISKGCGLVEFARPDAAAAAVHSLHQAFTWPHSHSPLVVEWVDAKRQATNRAARVSRAAAAAAAAAAGSGDLLGGRSPMRRALADHTAAMAGASVYAHHRHAAGGGYAQAAQLPFLPALPGGSSQSCPLPRVQVGWVQSSALGRPAAAHHMPYVPSGAVLQFSQAISEPVGEPYLCALGGDSDPQCLLLPQPPSDTSSGSWWPVQQAGIAAAGGSLSASSGSSCMASFETVPSTVAAVTLASTLSNGSTMLAASPGDIPSANTLSGAALAPPSLACGDVYAAPTAAEQQQPGLAIAAAAALGAGRTDHAWQALQQQNLMLLQPLSNPAEDYCAGPAATSGFVAADRQHGAPLPVAMVPAGGKAGSPQQQPVYSMPPASHALILQQQGPYALCYPAAAQQQVQAAGRQAGQWWQQQQPQQQQGHQQYGGSGGELVMVVPLTMRQLQAMSAVLPEVPRLTGARASLSAAGSASGPVQLTLSGAAHDIQAAHSVASMLLSKLGVDEPLAMPPALVRAH